MRQIKACPRPFLIESYDTFDEAISHAQNFDTYIHNSLNISDPTGDIAAIIWTDDMLSVQTSNGSISFKAIEGKILPVNGSVLQTPLTNDDDIVIEFATGKRRKWDRADLPKRMCGKALLKLFFSSSNLTYIYVNGLSPISVSSLFDSLTDRFFLYWSED